MIPRDSRLTRHPNCLTDGVHLSLCNSYHGPDSLWFLQIRTARARKQRGHFGLQIDIHGIYHFWNGLMADP
jgi:hypothetical protein